MLSQLNLKADDFPGTKHKKVYHIALWTVIAIGAFIRLYHYFYNRSLWEDEIYLSAGIVNKSLVEILTRPLPYLQKAPLGYLLVSRFCVWVFGNHEMALRLYPLICGLLSLFLFVPVARYYLKPLGVVVGLAMLAFSPPIIYHNVEAKPYGTELLATLIVLWLFIKYQNQTHWRKLLVWGIYGSIIVWFTYTAIFVLAATGITLAISYTTKRNWKALIRMVVPGAMWLLSFAVSYFLYAKEGSESGWLVDFWQKHDGYIPLSPVPAAMWLLHRVFSFLHYPVGLSWYNDWSEHNVIKQILNRMAFGPLLFLALGVPYFYKYNKRFLLLVGIAILITVSTSALKLYPFHERLTVYLAPYIIILLASGCEAIVWPGLFVKVIRYILIALLLFGPFKNSLEQVIKPRLFADYKKSYQREALFYLQQHIHQGDAVYIHRTDIPGYTFYKSIYPLHFNAVLGHDFRNTTSNFKDYLLKTDAELKSLHAKRIWIVYNTLDAKVGEYVDMPQWYYRNHDGMERLEKHLNQLGRKVDEFRPTDGRLKSDVSVLLIELH
ncbi:glycosyltransferase family 39 protein [Mucilaginibacter lacusdianchii]|uniref:glycosyltransferase family 39 protein n=1 Tax=Mucilaginibacter lacusdianchii TaxID=2684211 RepID=UPI00131BEC65|nr:glycosyltransferase family 39 protein [Mucilaginibacter sp. JXJ CY 39]